MMKHFYENLKILLFIIGGMVSATSCDNDSHKAEDYSETKTLSVAPYKDFYAPPGWPVMDILGYVVTDSKNNTYVIDCIHGFEDLYEEGYTYVITVKVTPVNPEGLPYEDFTGNSYALLEVISKEKVE